MAVKSEIDSRVLVYPLMKALKSYGSILVISSNRQLRRLIDDPAYQTFRNMTVIVDECGAVDDVYNDFGIANGDYDFVILDNVGCLSYDICFVLQGSRSSQEFDDELALLRSSSDIKKIVCVQFGKSSKPDKKEMVKKRTDKRSKDTDQVTSDYDPSDKFRQQAGIKDENIAVFKQYTGKFPTFQQIEQLEAEHIFYDVDSAMVSMFYETFKSEIGTDPNQFRKEVAKKDEGGSNIKPIDPNR